jgi:hypothetical protein
MLIFVPSITCEKVASSLARICAWSSVALSCACASVKSRTFLVRGGVGGGETADQPNFASIAARIASSDWPSLWRRTASFPAPWQMWQIFAIAPSPS